MKASSARTLTLALIASLLTGSGICVALRHSADERRASEARAPSSLPTSSNSFTSGNDRSVASQRTTRTRITDRDDFRLRLTALLTSSDPSTRSQNLLDLLDGLSPADFPIVIQQMRKICRFGDPMLALVFAAWAEADPAAALKHELENKRLDKSSALKVWAQRDPIAAINWLLGNNDDGKSARFVHQVLAVFANDNPAAAIAWAKDHDDPTHAHLATVLRGMLPKHLKEMIHEFSQLPDETRQSLITEVGKQIGTLNPAERQQWLDSFPTDEARADAVATMIPGIASFEERLSLLAEYPAALDHPGSAPLYQQWIKQDEAAALASLANFPPGPNRNAAVDAAVGGLGQQGEIRKALDLMNRYPEAVNDMTLLNWIAYAGNNERQWDLIFSTLPRVGNEKSREYLYHHVFRDWIRIDHKSARAWLASHPEIPDSVRTAFAAP